MAYRVIQFATGMLGTEAAIGIVGRPDLELVGTWVHSDEKVGRDVGELCGLGPVGVQATNDKDALLAMEADCVSYMVDRTWDSTPKRRSTRWSGSCDRARTSSPRCGRCWSTRRA